MVSWFLLLIKYLQDKISVIIYLECIIIPLMLACSVRKACPQGKIAVELAWERNDEVDLEGYRVFRREEGLDYDYNAPAWEGYDPNDSDPNCVVRNMEEGKVYYFVARAFDTWGNESENSNEVRYPPFIDYGQSESGCFIRDALKPDP